MWLHILFGIVGLAIPMISKWALEKVSEASRIEFVLILWLVASLDWGGMWGRYIFASMLGDYGSSVFGVLIGLVIQACLLVALMFILARWEKLVEELDAKRQLKAVSTFGRASRRATPQEKRIAMMLASLEKEKAQLKAMSVRLCELRTTIKCDLPELGKVAGRIHQIDFVIRELNSQLEKLGQMREQRAIRVAVASVGDINMATSVDTARSLIEETECQLKAEREALTEVLAKQAATESAYQELSRVSA